MAKAVLINTATLSQSIKLLREARSLIREEKNHLQNGHFFAADEVRQIADGAQTQAGKGAEGDCVLRRGRFAVRSFL